MFNILRRKSSQTSPQTILDRGVDILVLERDAHLSAMNRLETVINDAQRAYNQHTRLYDALNNTLFAVNHPFDGGAALEAAINAEIDVDLSVDQPSDEEREEARGRMSDAERRQFDQHPVNNAKEALAIAGVPLDCPPIPFRRPGVKRRTTAE